MQIAKDGSLVTLHWHRRLYDTRGNAHPNARRRHNFQKLRLDMQRHCAAVDIAKWRQLLTHISNRNDRAICPTITDIVDRARQYHQSCTDHLEVKLLTCCVQFHFYTVGHKKGATIFTITLANVDRFQSFTFGFVDKLQNTVK